MPLPRYDILNVAKQCPGANLAVLNIAEQPMASAEISEKVFELESALSRTKRNRNLSYFVVLSLFFGAAAWLNEETAAATYLYWTLLALANTGFTMSTIYKIHGIESVIPALHPIANTIACHEAATFVKSKHSNVLDWRDCAVNERGQLYGFDVEVMRCLYLVAQSDDLLKLTQEACRIAHGVEPAAL